MKETSVEPILDKHFKEYDTLSMVKLYHLVEEYRAKHPDVYVQYDRDYLHTLIEFNPDKYYWDSKAELIRKQEIITCLCCGSRHRKYPETEKFGKIKKYIEKVKFWALRNRKKM